MLAHSTANVTNVAKFLTLSLLLLTRVFKSEKKVDPCHALHRRRRGRKQG
jgi:hypothetical protein